MAFKDALLEEMDRCGFRKVDLAKAVAVDKSTVTSWTQGRSEPKAAQFARLCKVMPRLRTVYDEV